MRGSHTAFFADADAATIAWAFRDALFGEKPRKDYFGLSLAEFKKALYSNHVVWAPDGDEAFDDGSYILQFDVGSDVRVVAFKSSPDGYDPETVRDVSLPADGFYAVLQQWHGAFETEWASLLAKSEATG